MEQQQSQAAHVVLLPYPAQGHIKPMFKLAQLLITVNPNVHVTFVNTQQNHDLLLLSSDYPSFRRRYPNFQLLSYRQDTPLRNSRGSPEKLSEKEFLEYALLSVKAAAKPALKEMLVSLMGKSREQNEHEPPPPPPPPTCIVADWVIMASCAVDVAKEFENYDIPVFALQTCCAHYMWLDFHNLKLIEQGQVPLRDKDMDKPVTSITGLENVFRRRDLSGFCRFDQVCKQVIEISTNYGLSAVSEASGLILNTFDQLEAPIISHLNSHFPNEIYTVGPLHALLNNVSKDVSASTDGSLFKEDRSCIAWLDSQPSRSVVYVSFGSLASLSRTQILEFGHGLVNSGKPFLWVIRPNSIIVEKNEDGLSPTQVLMELETMSKGRGLMVDWAPQEMVLAHQAIGGFLTRCGWNSTLESIYANVPMICWSTGVDQHVNSRCVSDLWKVGFDMKDTCDRLIVEKLVKDLMEDKRDQVVKSMDKISKLAQESVMEGGSSYSNLEKLIARIQSLVPSAWDKPQNI